MRCRDALGRKRGAEDGYESTGYVCTEGSTNSKGAGVRHPVAYFVDIGQQTIRRYLMLVSTDLVLLMLRQ
jgi:hypothetical protein